MPDTSHTEIQPSLPVNADTARATRSEAELQVLRALCSTHAGAEQRMRVCRAIGTYRFVEPEYQVVFEAIRSIAHAPHISGQQLVVRLNNAGFPDVDLDKYFAAEALDFEAALALAQRLGPDDDRLRGAR